MAVDSKTLINGPGAIYAGVPSFSRLLGWGTVIFQLSGLFCRCGVVLVGIHGAGSVNCVGEL